MLTPKGKIRGETHLHLIRFAESERDTIGALYFNEAFECFILEDEEREDKIPGSTRIPNGTYEIVLRKEGGMHDDYSDRYDFHEGMLHLLDVPGFEWVYIHIGNKHENTHGCLLTGDSVSSNANGSDGYVGSSGPAYKRLYPKVVEALAKGNKVLITVEEIPYLRGRGAADILIHDGNPDKSLDKKEPSKKNKL